jgi:hypothetical protein
MSITRVSQGEQTNMAHEGVCAHIDIDNHRYCGQPARQIKGGLCFCDSHLEVGLGLEPNEVRTGVTEFCGGCGQTLYETEVKASGQRFLLDAEGTYHHGPGGCGNGTDFCNDCGTKHEIDDECADSRPTTS